MCFLRDESVNFAERLLDCALEHKEKIFGVGLDSCEVGYPAQLFEKVYLRAIKNGFIPVAHAGEECGP